MINLLRADFYKLIRRKSFYICALLGMLLSGLSIWSLNQSFSGMPASLFGYNASTALSYGITGGSLFCLIFVSMFVSGEFSFGTMKNIISSGQSRINIYLSKMIMTLMIITVYTVLCGIVAFAVGGIFWGFEGISRDDYLSILRMIGLVISVELAMNSLYIMVSFLVRGTGGTISINVLMRMIFRDFVLPIINAGVYKFFKNSEFDAAKYWPDTYMSPFLSLTVETKDITMGLTVCLVAILISSAIGIFTFVKRDIK